MNVFSVDVNEYIQYTLDAYCKVFGEKYRDIIIERLDNSCIVNFRYLEGVQKYVTFLKVCKQRALSVKFLKNVGENLEGHEPKTYAEPLDDYLDNLIVKYGIDKYEVADEYKEIYNKLQEEYTEWEKELEPYEKYLENGYVRLEEIFEEKTNELSDELLEKFPQNIKEKMNNISTNKEEWVKRLLPGDEYGRYDLEYFSKDDENDLTDEEISVSDKQNIYYRRLSYFKTMGIIDEVPEMEKAEGLYKDLINKEEVKKIIPSQDFIEYVEEHRIKKDNDVGEEFVYTSEDFKKATDDESLEQFVMGGFMGETPSVSQLVCDGEYTIPVLFYTVSTGGILDFVYLHETCHVIESSMNEEGKCKIGFEPTGDNDQNPYNPDNQKYERMNETFTDMFAMEALEELRKNDIYIYEPKEILISDVSNYNTNSILKDMLKPFLKKYRKEIIQARIGESIQGLLNTVGEENYEELNDTINRVDYLIDKKSLWPKLEEETNDEIVQEYKEQLKRLDNIYKNMDKYKEKEEFER